MSGIRECNENLLIKSKARPEGYFKVVGRGEMGLKHLEFGLLSLGSGEWPGDTGDCEQALDIHAGVISIDITGPGGRSFQRIGGREEVFKGVPTVVYIPANSKYLITVEEAPVDIAVFSAFAPESQTAPTVIGRAETDIESVGRDGWRRDVYTVIGDRFPASKLVLGETVCTGWSSYPPHKHDAFNPPNELPLEEICFFRVTPAQGFGMIRIYTPPNDPGPMDEAYALHDGDTVVIPRGYHPLTVAPGCTMHYTWALAGDIRRPSAGTIAPRYSWIESAV